MDKVKGYFNFMVFILTIIVCVAYSQEMGMPGMQKMMKNVENNALIRMINELEITDEQMPGFISKFREMANLFRQQNENRNRLAEQLQKMVSGNSSDEKIQEKISEFEKYSDKMYEEFKKFRDDMKKVLTPRQQVRFLLIVDSIRNMLTDVQGIPTMPFKMMQGPQMQPLNQGFPMQPGNVNR